MSIVLIVVALILLGMFWRQALKGAIVAVAAAAIIGAVLAAFLVGSAMWKRAEPAAHEAGAGNSSIATAPSSTGWIPDDLFPPQPDGDPKTPAPSKITQGGNHWTTDDLFPPRALQAFQATARPESGATQPEPKAETKSGGADWDVDDLLPPGALQAFQATAPPMPPASAIPAHSSALIQRAIDYSTGYVAGINRTIDAGLAGTYKDSGRIWPKVCVSPRSADWMDGCKGGVHDATRWGTTRATYQGPNEWLKRYDDAVTGRQVDCGNGATPSSAGCWAGNKDRR